MSNKIGVIVIGGHVQGLGIVRIFGKRGIPIIVLDKTSINIAKHSKYCRKFYKYSDLMELLEKFSQEGIYKKWLLMPTHDEEVFVISKNRQKLSDYYTVSTDSWEKVKIFYNKKFSYQLADKLGIPYPKSFFPNSIDDLKNLQISYPCIIKPAVIGNFYKKAKKKVFLANNSEELIMKYKKALSIIPKDEIIIQEIIPGSSENQYSACFLYNENKSLVNFVARRKRQHPIDFGNATTFAETVADKNVLLKYGEEILKNVSYKGVCEVEFKYDERDKKYKFLEVNPRTWKWHSISEKSDSPFLPYLYDLLIQNKESIKKDWEEAAFKHIITDFPTIIKMKSKKIYTKSKIKNLQYAVWDKKDIKPAVFELLYLAYLLLTR